MGSGAARHIGEEKISFLCKESNCDSLFQSCPFRVFFFYISVLNFLRQPNAQYKICVHFKDVSLTCFGTSVPFSQST